MRSLSAEFVGTFAYVAAICGAALLPGADGSVQGGLAVALSAGFAYAAMCYALGGAAGCHFNPAITLGLVAAGRFETRSALPYVAAQVAGALLAAGLFAWLAEISPDKAMRPLSEIANTFDEQGAGISGFAVVFVAEGLAAALILVLFLGATAAGVPPGFAPIALGLLFVVLHLVLLPISNAALNPARATGLAVFSGSTPLLQLWLFWVAPIIGGVLGGLFGRWLNED